MNEQMRARDVMLNEWQEMDDTLAHTHELVNG